MSEPTYQPLFDFLLRITGKAFTEDEMSEIKNVCNSEVETLLKEQLQQKEDEISILADLVKGRDLTIQQKDEEIDRLKQWQKDYYSLWNPVDDYMRNSDMVKLGDSVSGKTLEALKSLTSYRELMGRMAGALDNYLSESKKQSLVEIYSQFEQLLTDYKNLEGC